VRRSDFAPGGVENSRISRYALLERLEVAIFGELLVEVIRGVQPPLFTVENRNGLCANRKIGGVLRAFKKRE